MIKTILFDIDGVLISSVQELFSVKFSREYGVPLEEIMSFIRNEAQLCKIGQADLKSELSKNLTRWNWNTSVEKLLEYWYPNNLDVNQELLHIIDKLRLTGVRCLIASDNERYRAEKLLVALEGSRHFDNSYFSFQLGTTKADPLFFKKILDSEGIADPQTVLLCDDRQRNLDVASTLGIQTHLYKNAENLSQSVGI